MQLITKASCNLKSLSKPTSRNANCVKNASLVRCMSLIKEHGRINYPQRVVKIMNLYFYQLVWCCDAQLTLCLLYVFGIVPFLNQKCTKCFIRYSLDCRGDMHSYKTTNIVVLDSYIKATESRHLNQIRCIFFLSSLIHFRLTKVQQRLCSLYRLRFKTENSGFENIWCAELGNFSCVPYFLLIGARKRHVSLPKDFSLEVAFFFIVSLNERYVFYLFCPWKKNQFYLFLDV